MIFYIIFQEMNFFKNLKTNLLKRRNLYLPGVGVEEEVALLNNQGLMSTGCPQFLQNLASLSKPSCPQ